MHLLGPATRVATTATSYAQIDKHGTLKGDLALKGAGDANLSGRTFPYLSPAERKRDTAQQPPPPLRYLNELADAVAQKGVKRITGNIIGNDAAWPWEPYASDWSIDDAVWGYGAPVSALTIVDNQLDLTVTPASRVDQAATVALIPSTGYYEIKADVKTAAAGTHADIRIDRDIGSRIVRVRGTVALGEPYSTEIAIEDPAEFAAQAFKQALEAHGIKVEGKAVAEHKPDVDMQGFSTESHVPVPALP